MKIHSCYIENFGTLSHFSMDFEGGLNTVLKENGWGKSTLAAFIKAMLFGIEYNRASENERKKYTPWNGGKFGGYMCFETGGRRYRVERSFGKTDKNDTFALYDLSTNMESRDYSERLGEELFGVDRASFEKSVYIGADRGENSLLTDIMSAKMTEVSYDDNDMDRLNEALNRLDRKASEIKAKRGNGGRMGEIRHIMEAQKQQLKECDGALQEIEAENEKIKEYEKILAEKKTCSEELHEEIGKYRISEKKREYEMLLREYDNTLAAMDNTLEFFQGNVPEKGRITSCEDAVSEYNAQAALSRQYSVTQEDKEELAELKHFFRAGIPTLSDLDRVNNDIMKYWAENQKLQGSIPDTNDIVRLEQLKTRFDSRILSDEEIDKIITRYEDTEGLERKLGNLQKELAELKEKPDREKSRVKRMRMTLYSVSALVIAAGLLCLLLNRSLGAGLIIGGIIAAAAGTLALRAPKTVNDNGETDELERLIADMESKMEMNRLACNDFIKRYGRNEEETRIIKILSDIRSDRDAYVELDSKVSDMNREYSGAQKETAALKDSLDSFFSGYYGDTSALVYQDALSEIKQRADRFKALRDTISAHNTAVKRALEYKDEIYGFIGNYFAEVTKPAEQLREIRKRLYELEGLYAEKEKRQAELAAFQQENDVGQLQNAVLPEKGLEELNGEQQRVSEEMSEITALIAGCRHRIDTLSITADRREDMETELERNQELCNELVKKYEIYTMAGELLKEAGESLSQKYVSGISGSFSQYMDMLGVRDKSDYHIDMKLDVRLDRDGGLHESRYFSTGKRDITEFCVRLALLDAVYRDCDKPVIIMDDPFVNFDDEMLKNAQKLIKELSMEYQIIYFVCHNSRMEKKQ